MRQDLQQDAKRMARRQTGAGKGDAPRSVKKDDYDTNFDKIKKNKCKKCKKWMCICKKKEDK